MTTNENNPPHPPSSKRVNELTLQLQSEVSKARSAHEAALLSLTLDCSKALHDLTDMFENRIQAMQQLHREYIAQIEAEISYLTEINDSQQIMLQNNIDYIKQLEERYIKKPHSPEG
jgi:hypothetical protein